MPSKMTYFDYDGSPAYRVGDDLNKVFVVMPSGKERQVKEHARFSHEAYEITQREYDKLLERTKLVTSNKLHKVGMIVPLGGSSCAKCKFLRNKDECGLRMWVETPKDKGGGGGNPKLPVPPTIYCCDGFEAAPKTA